MKFDLRDIVGNSEEKIIDKYFKPLSFGSTGAAQLSDDGFILSSDSKDYAITTDNLIEDIHFPKNCSGDLICLRAISRSLSDLASMGAKPYAWLSNIAMTSGMGQDYYDKWFLGFHNQAKLLNDRYKMHLVGGDFSSHDGKIHLSTTFLGRLDHKITLRRSYAKNGYILALCGNLGLANLALSSVINNQDTFGFFDDEDLQILKSAYYQPNININLGLDLAKSSSTSKNKIAAIDISDGLLIDSARLALASKVDLIIDLDKLPISQPMEKWLKHKKDFRPLLAGGDDYALLVAISPDEFKTISKDHKLVEIGRVAQGSGIIDLKITEKHKNYLFPDKIGYLHKL